MSGIDILYLHDRDRLRSALLFHTIIAVTDLKKTEASQGDLLSQAGKGRTPKKYEGWLQVCVLL